MNNSKEINAELSNEQLEMANGGGSSLTLEALMLIMSEEHQRAQYVGTRIKMEIMHQDAQLRYEIRYWQEEKRHGNVDAEDHLRRLNARASEEED